MSCQGISLKIVLTEPGQSVNTPGALPQECLKGNLIEKSQETRKSSVIFKAFLMSLGTLSSRFLGLFREVLLAALFDRTVTDAWAAAFRIPNLFRRLFGEGSLAVSFQPILIETQNLDLKNKTNQAQILSHTLHAFLIGILALLTVGGILFSQEILGFILDDQYVARVEAFNMTVRLAQIMFGFLFFICLFAYYMAILNAHGKFGWPAVAPVFFNISLIVTTVLPQDYLQTPGDFLAWGVVVGGFLQMAILIPPLLKLGIFPKLSWSFKNPQFLRVLRNMIPGFLGLGLSQITLIVNTGFASSLGEGVISYIAWADRLLELPLSLISVSLGTAMLPTLAQYWSEGDPKKMIQTSERIMSINLFLSAIAAVGLFILSEPIVRIIFERGKFLSSDSLAVISVVQVYAISMIPISLVRVLVPSYYAVKNTWFPALVSGVCLAVHLIIAPVLMDRYGLQGLNLSSLISATLNFLILICGFGYLIHSFIWKTYFLKTVQVMASSTAMAAVMIGLLQILPKESNTLSWILQIVVVGGLGIATYFLSSLFVGHPETRFILDKLSKKIRKS